MKTTDITEGIISDFIGRQIDKSMMNKLSSTTANTFRDMFVDKISSALDNAQSSGLIDPAKPRTTQKFLLDVVNKHMKDTDLSKYKTQINNQIRTISANLLNGTPDDEIAKLGKLLYSVSLSSTGKKDLSASTEKITDVIDRMVGGANGDDLQHIIDKSLQQLHKIDRTRWVNIVKNIKNMKV